MEYEDDGSWVLINHRLTALEKRVDAGFVHLDSRLDTLAFVRVDVYEANEKARDQEVEVLRKGVADSRRLNMWVLSTIGLLVLGLVISVIAQVAGL